MDQVDGHLLHQRHVVLGRPASGRMAGGTAVVAHELAPHAVNPLGGAAHVEGEEAGVAVAHGALEQPEVLEIETVHRRELGAEAASTALHAWPPVHRPFRLQGVGLDH